jgi:hypothetical protein
MEVHDGKRDLFPARRYATAAANLPTLSASGSGTMVAVACIGTIARVMSSTSKSWATAVCGSALCVSRGRRPDGRCQSRPKDCVGDVREPGLGRCKPNLWHRLADGAILGEAAVSFNRSPAQAHPTKSGAKWHMLLRPDCIELFGAHPLADLPILACTDRPCRSRRKEEKGFRLLRSCRRVPRTVTQLPPTS